LKHEEVKTGRRKQRIPRKKKKQKGVVRGTTFTSTVVGHRKFPAVKVPRMFSIYLMVMNDGLTAKLSVGK
jgi:hypothetical protein